MVGRLLKYGRGGTMIQRVCGGVGLLLFVLIVFAAQDVVSAVGGTVQKADAAAKTMAGKTAARAADTFHFPGPTPARGTEATSQRSTDAVRGRTEGSAAVRHYTAQ